MNTNNLPPLPEIPLLRTGQVQMRDFTLEDMQAYAVKYGQLCRQQALEEAAEHFAETPDREMFCPTVADEIRSIK